MQEAPVGRPQIGQQGLVARELIGRVRLKHGDLLHYALLACDPGDVGAIDNDDDRNARAELRSIGEAHLERLVECRGETRERAAVILRSGLSRADLDSLVELEKVITADGVSAL